MFTDDFLSFYVTEKLGFGFAPNNCFAIDDILIISSNTLAEVSYDKGQHFVSTNFGFMKSSDPSVYIRNLFKVNDEYVIGAYGKLFVAEKRLPSISPSGAFAYIKAED